MPTQRQSRPQQSRRGGQSGGGHARNGQHSGGRSHGGPRPPSSGASTAVLQRPSTVDLPSALTVKELSDAIVVSPVDVIKSLMKNGMMVTINHEIDFDTAAIVASEFGVEVQERSLAQEMAETIANPNSQREVPDDPASLKPRPPVVTVMGHVDHGKTSLLDAIRQTSVASGEAGGITQHIGAYQAEKRGQKITFLDTPGHAAFTAMRARGAQATDVVIIVVAADDGVMPQTVEAINHARAANVPLIVAINKIDRAGANVDRVLQELADIGVVVEQWGGDTISVPVSALRKEGLDDLLEMVLLVTEIADLKANPDRPARGVAIEARLDRSRGPICTVLIQNGTLHIGDNILVGATAGKVRAMFNDRGKPIKKAEPSMPVEVLGLTDVPSAGDVLQAYTDDRIARALAAERQRERRAESLTPLRKMGLEDLFAAVQAGQTKELNLIVKADVQGSIGAISHALAELGGEAVKVSLIHSGTGAPTESDVMLASASHAIVVAFNTRVDPSVRKVAEVHGVDIRIYQIIYKLTEDIQAALQGLLEPVYRDVVVGHAVVQKVFPAGKTQRAAGVLVRDGSLTRGQTVRVLRGQTVVHTGKIGTLRRFKDDVRELATTYEGGVGIDDFQDFAEGDILEALERERVS